MQTLHSSFPQAYSSRQRMGIGLLLLFFVPVFCLISFVNHYCFHSGALDLGIYHHGLYSYAHLRMDDTPLQHPLHYNLLTDHFEPILMLYSPLHYLFGGYTLLVIQVAMLVLGAFGVMRYVWLVTDSTNISLLAFAHFLGLWGLYGALSFDFHNNVTAACLVPWLFCAFEQRRWRHAWLLAALIILTKENMALWMVFIGLGLALHYRSEKVRIRQALLMSACAAVYFVSVVIVIIPALRVDGQNYTIARHYAQTLGSNTQEIVHTLLFRPQYVLKLFFVNSTGNPQFNWIKTELHVMVLLSGGIFLLRPAFLLMLTSVYCQKLLMEDPTRWGINGHYSIEFAPILSMAAFTYMGSMRNPRTGLTLAWITLALAFVANLASIDSRRSVWYDSDRMNISKPGHYRREGVDLTVLHEQLRTVVPADAVISVQTNFAPWLYQRKTIYAFPYVGDAQYIVLHPALDTYPLNAEEFAAEVAALQSDTAQWQTFYHQHDLLILQRR